MITVNHKRDFLERLIAWRLVGYEPPELLRPGLDIDELDKKARLEQHVIAVARKNFDYRCQ